MALDARVKAVYVNECGGGQLVLEDRPARGGRSTGIAGQNALFFDDAPEEVTGLNGLEIWGGSGFVMLGDVQIAQRYGYTKIKFCDDAIFNMAVAAAHRRRGRSVA